MKKLNKLSIIKVISIPIVSVALATTFINATETKSAWDIEFEKNNKLLKDNLDQDVSSKLKKISKDKIKKTGFKKSFAIQNTTTKKTTTFDIKDFSGYKIKYSVIYIYMENEKNPKLKSLYESKYVLTSDNIIKNREEVLESDVKSLLKKFKALLTLFKKSTTLNTEDYFLYVPSNNGDHLEQINFKTDKTWNDIKNNSELNSFFENETKFNNFKTFFNKYFISFKNDEKTNWKIYSIHKFQYKDYPIPLENFFKFTNNPWNNENTILKSINTITLEEYSKLTKQQKTQALNLLKNSKKSDLKNKNRENKTFDIDKFVFKLETGNKITKVKLNSQTVFTDINTNIKFDGIKLYISYTGEFLRSQIDISIWSKISNQLLNHKLTEKFQIFNRTQKKVELINKSFQLDKFTFFVNDKNEIKQYQLTGFVNTLTEFTLGYEIVDGTISKITAENRRKNKINKIKELLTNESGNIFNEVKNKITSGTLSKDSDGNVKISLSDSDITTLKNYKIFTIGPNEYIVKTDADITGKILTQLRNQLTNGSEFNNTIASLTKFMFHDTNGQLQVNLSTQETANKVNVPNYNVVTFNTTSYIVDNLKAISGELLNKLKENIENNSTLEPQNDPATHFTIKKIKGLNFYHDGEKLKVNLPSQTNKNKVELENYQILSVASKEYVIDKSKQLSNDIISKITTYVNSNLEFNSSISTLQGLIFSDSNGTLAVKLSGQAENLKAFLTNYKVIKINGMSYQINLMNKIAGSTLSAIQTKLSSINGSVITSSNTIVGLDVLKFYPVGDKLQVKLSDQNDDKKVDVPNYKVVSINSQNYIVKTDAPITGLALTAIQTKLSSINGPVITSSNTIVGLDGLKFYKEGDKLQVKLTSQADNHKVNIDKYKVITYLNIDYIVDHTKTLTNDILSFAKEELKKANGNKVNTANKITTDNFEFTVNASTKKITTLKVKGGSTETNFPTTENNYVIVGQNQNLYLVIKSEQLKGNALTFATSKLTDDKEVSIKTTSFTINSFTFTFNNNTKLITDVELTGYATTKTAITTTKQIVSFDGSKYLIVDNSKKITSKLTQITNYIKDKQTTLKQLNDEKYGFFYKNDNGQLQVKLISQDDSQYFDVKSFKVFVYGYRGDIAKQNDEVFVNINSPLSNWVITTYAMKQLFQRNGSLLSNVNSNLNFDTASNNGSFKFSKDNSGNLLVRLKATDSQKPAKINGYKVIKFGSDNYLYRKDQILISKSPLVIKALKLLNNDIKVKIISSISAFQIDEKDDLIFIYNKKNKRITHIMVKGETEKLEISTSKKIVKRGDAWFINEISNSNTGQEEQVSENTQENKEKKSLSKTMIIGIAVGVAIPVIGILALIIYFSKKKKNNKKTNKEKK